MMDGEGRNYQGLEELGYGKNENWRLGIWRKSDKAPLSEIGESRKNFNLLKESLFIVLIYR